MISAIREEVPLAQITTYKEASRNLDFNVTNMIQSQRVLPDEWKKNSIVKLAHDLYWAERESEVHVSQR